MRKFLFVFASTATLAMVSPAVAQYMYPPPGVGPGYIAPGYIAPGYIVPGYIAPGYIVPGYIAPGYTNPGYMWRKQRLNEDWRTNPVQDGQLRENYERTLGSIGITDPNAGAGECAKGFSEDTCRRRQNAIESGSLDVTDPNAGECAKGFSEETCRRRGQKYNPPRQN
jgi:hypothetical protein